MNVIPKLHLSGFFLVATALSLGFPVHGNSEPRSPIKFDEFGSLPCDDEKARVDNYGRSLQETPEGVAVVIVYAGRSDTRVGEVYARLFGIRDRLKSVSKVDQNRVVLLAGGAREQLTVQFWILPPEGRDSVKLLLYSDNAPTEIHLKPPRMEKWQYDCREASRVD